MGAILFDLDGTLIDSTQDIALAANAAAKRLGFAEQPLDVVHSFIGDGARLLMARHLATDDSALIERAYGAWREEYEAVCLHNTRLLPGILDLLDALAGRTLAVISNKPEAFCLQILRGLKVLERFAAVKGGDSFDTKKPDPGPVLGTLRELKVRAAAAVMVGDGIQDMRAARAAHVRALGVTWGQNDAERLAAHGADEIFASPAALRERLCARPESA